MIAIKEYIEFGSFNSKDLNLVLQDRDAPTPDEKEVIEDIPFMQGVLDFSTLTGERIFNTREITYAFKVVNSTYAERKDIERDLKQKLMSQFDQKLYDTHDNGYYWLGKCKSVKISHNPVKRNFTATITFTVYPFMFSITGWFDDIWDSFDFDNGVAGFTKYQVSGVKKILLVSTSVNSIGPEIEVSSDMRVTLDGRTYLFKVGKSTSLSFGLKPGVNEVTVEGTGTISFRWHAEVMG